MYDENSNAAVATPGSVASAAQTQGITASQLPAAVTAGNTAIVSQLLNVKDSRWLQVEVCREFQRGQCARSDQECKFAHPPPHVDVQQGRVTACYDSIKGRCTRENPKCKYLHPPQHIKDQLLINGRNNLTLKNLLSAQLNQGAPQPMVNPTLQMQQFQLQQQHANLAAANMMPGLPFPYYQGMMYPAAMLQADPYQAAVNQQLQAAALLQSGSAHSANAGLLAAAPSQLLQHQLAALQAMSVSQAGQAGLLQSTPSASHVAAVQHLSRKRQLEDEDASLYNLAATISAAAGVPCKRPAVDKNGTVVFQTAGAQPGAGGQQYNPYLIPGLQGYVPAVSFSGQVPPRY